MPFEITTCSTARLMRVRFIGNWTLETVDQLRQATRAEEGRLAASGCPPHELLILLDRRDQGPHPQDVVEALRQLSIENSGKAKRVALLISGMLTKMQVKRINVTGTTQVFRSEALALEWLATGRAELLQFAGT